MSNGVENGLHHRKRSPLPVIAEPTDESAHTTEHNNASDDAKAAGGQKRSSLVEEKIHAVEWLHHFQRRPIRLRLCPKPQHILIENRKGDRIRVIDIAPLPFLHAEITNEPSRDPLVFIRLPKDYDLVLVFDTLTNRSKFLLKLQAFLKALNKEMPIFVTDHDVVYQQAETKERRQKKLERFFREAYSQAFELGGNVAKSSDSDAAEDVLKTRLSKSEFADALGMRAKNPFIERMFACVDRDRDGFICFKEFLDTVIVFAKGNVDEKLRILFDMCDQDGDGIISREEFSDLVRSVVDLAKTHRCEPQCEGVISGMFTDAGLEHKQHLTYEDFSDMLAEYTSDILQVSLDCKGSV